jgi:hypothetical protein
MTAQEKIQELAMAALRSAPPSAGVPKPATFMAAPEKLKSAIPVAAPVETPAPSEPVVTPVAVTAPLPQPEEKPFKDEGDPELRAMLEARDAQANQSLKRRSLAVSLVAFVLFGSAGVWVAVSPTAQAKIARIAPLFQESVRDVKSLANTKENFDKALEKVAVHGGSIDEATRSMGADPNSVTKEQEAELDAAMGQMMGGEGHTTADRNKALQDKLGFVEKLVNKKDS